MSLPIPEYGKDDKETIQNLMDTVMKLRKELEYVLYHLGDENIPDLPVIKEDIVNANASISVLEDEIVLKIDKNGVISAINLSPEGVDIQGTRINLVGAVTVLSTITGDLGTITAGDIYGINIYSANIDIDDDVRIGDKLIMNGNSFGAGIEWNNSSTASIYYDPGSEAIHIFAPGGVWANGTQIDI